MRTTSPILMSYRSLWAVLVLSLLGIVGGQLSARAATAPEGSGEYMVMEVKDPEPFRVTAYIQGVGPAVGANLLGSTVTGIDKFCIPPGGVVLFGSGDETLPVKGGADGVEGLVADLVSGSASSYSSTDIAIVEGVIEYMSDVEEIQGGAKGYLVPAGKMPETNNFSRKDGCGCSTNMDFGAKIEEVFDLSKNNLSITEYIEKNAVEPFSVKVDTDAVTGGVGEERLDQITEMIAQIQGAASDPATSTEESSEQSGEGEEATGQDQEKASGPNDGDGGGDADTEAPGTESDTSSGEGGSESAPTTNTDLQPPSSQTPLTPPGTSGPSDPSTPTGGDSEPPSGQPPIPFAVD